MESEAPGADNSYNAVIILRFRARLLELSDPCQFATKQSDVTLVKRPSHTGDQLPDLRQRFPLDLDKLSAAVLAGRVPGRVSLDRVSGN